jgi:ATP-dependent exoDNAse (exonuclease V) beta subunit
MPSYELLWNIYDKTDIMAVMSPWTAEREHEILMLLFGYAREFEESGYRGLFRFTPISSV